MSMPYVAELKATVAEPGQDERPAPSPDGAGPHRSMTEHLLELDRITKTYPGVVALDQVSLAVGRGEIVGLIGENGAGKSTLMKVLGGVVEPSAGKIRLDGKEHAALSVREAMAGGIAFVHQELNLFDNLDAAANVFIGREPRYGGPLRLIDRRKLREQVRGLLQRVGADFSPDTPVADLSLAQRQLLEIAKALSLEARVVIMDEPTSSLTLSETDRLMGVIADLKAHGVSIIFISHRLNEIKRCADRVVVLRDGKVVGELARDEIDPAGDDPPDDRPRSEIPLYPAPGRPRRDHPGAGRSQDFHLSRPCRQPVGPRRRDPGPGRAGRLGTDGAGPGDVRHRRAGRGILAPRRGAHQGALPPRGHRARHLSGAGGPQEAEPAARRLAHRQHLLCPTSIPTPG